MSRPTFDPVPRATLLEWLQLLRLPNVFTAMADSLLGFFVTHAGAQPIGVLASLVGASSLLYLAGMVLNDVYDLEIDQIERPGRPLPSGRIELRTAKLLGYGLLFGGIGLGWLATALSGDLRCGLTATALAFAVWLYDILWKNTRVAPLGMGACRMLNVLLGMSAASTAWQPMHLVLAAGVGLYIVGLTWFARGEAGISNRWRLAAGTAVMLAGLAVVCSYPYWWTDDVDPVSRPRMIVFAYEGIRTEFDMRWFIFWVLIGLLITRHCAGAILDPVPGRVQRAVKLSIMSLIVIDAAACTAIQDLPLCLVILGLLLPTMLLGRWVYST